MKKLGLLFVVLCSVFLFGCKNNYVNSDGFYVDLDAASKVAQKKNQNMLIFVTSEQNDELSENLINNVLRTEEFKNTLANEFVIVQMDFSRGNSIPNPDDSKKVVKQKVKNLRQINKNSLFVSKVNLSSTPAAFVFSKEKYFVGSVNIISQIQSAEQLKTVLDNNAEIMQNFLNLVAAVNTKKGLEKVFAIEEVYNATPDIYKLFLEDLLKTAISIDKNNDSLLMPKYLMTKADCDAMNLLLDGKTVEAAKVYEVLALSDFLIPELKQQAYYFAAYVLGSDGESSVQQILEYLELSMNACPESEAYEGIKNYYDKLVEIAIASAEENDIEFNYSKVEE